MGGGNSSTTRTQQTSAHTTNQQQVTTGGGQAIRGGGSITNKSSTRYSINSGLTGSDLQSLFGFVNAGQQANYKLAQTVTQQSAKQAQKENAQTAQLAQVAIAAAVRNKGGSVVGGGPGISTAPAPAGGGPQRTLGLTVAEWTALGGVATVITLILFWRAQH